MKKYVATILLDRDDKYVDDDGHIPKRPEWDKNLLAAMVHGETVSHEGYKMLPPSMKETVDVTNRIEPYPVTIEEIDALADILIVSRSPERMKDGKKFRFDSFEPILKLKEIEIWKRKPL